MQFVLQRGRESEFPPTKRCWGVVPLPSLQETKQRARKPRPYDDGVIV